MTSLQQTRFIKIFPDEKIKITEGISVFGLMQECATEIELLPESFNFFRIVQKNCILLPFIRKISTNMKYNSTPLFFRVVDLHFNIEEYCNKDLSLLSYLYNQAMFDFFISSFVPDVDRFMMIEIIVVDILRLRYHVGNASFIDVYNLYFEMYPNRTQFKDHVSFVKFTEISKTLKSCFSETLCMIHIVKSYAEKLYPSMGIIKRTFNVKIQTKSTGKIKQSERKFSISVNSDHVSAVSDDKVFETLLSYNKIRSIVIHDKLLLSINYCGLTQSEPISVSFKTPKLLEAFAALVEYYFCLLSPSKLLLTNFFDIKTDDKSVQFTESYLYNLISRNPHLSHSIDPINAKLGLEKILNRSGTYAIICNGNSLCLLYAIQDRIQPKAVLCKGGLYQIADNVARRYNDIRDLVLNLKPKDMISEERVNLTNQVSDSLLIDVLTSDDFVFNIPPMLVDISRPAIYSSWINKVFNGHFENLSGDKIKCKCIEFSKHVSRKHIFDISQSLLKVSFDEIVQYIGLCKSGRSPKLYAFVNFPSSMVYLNQFILTDSVPVYMKLKIIEKIVYALQKLHGYKIEHSCPAPHHILIDPLSCTSAYDPLEIQINLKLTDVGITKKMFLQDYSKNPFCQEPIQRDAPCELRWMPGSFMMHSSPNFSVSLDRYSIHYYSLTIIIYSL